MAIERSVGEIRKGLIDAASKEAASHSDLIARGNFLAYKASLESIDNLLNKVSRVNDLWVETRGRLEEIGIEDPSVEVMLQVFQEIVASKESVEEAGTVLPEEAPNAEEVVHEEEAVAASGPAVTQEVRPTVPGLLTPPAVNEIKFDEGNRTIEVGDKKIRISADEWNVLATLATIGENLKNGDALARQVFGFGKRSRPKFNAAVSTLRKKLDESVSNQGLIVTELREVQGSIKPRGFYGLRVTYPEALDKGSVDEGAHAVTGEAEHHLISEPPEELVAAAEEAGAGEETEEPEGNKLNEREIYLLAKLIKDNYPELLSSGDDEELVEKIISDFSGPADVAEVRRSLGRKLENYFANENEFYDLNADSDNAALLLATIVSLDQDQRERLMGQSLSEGIQGAVGKDDERYFRHGGFTLDREERRIIAGEASVKLSSTESEILDFVLQNKGRVVLYGEFISVLGWRSELAYKIPVGIAPHLTLLRKKFKEIGIPFPVKTVRGTGLIFE